MNKTSYPFPQSRKPALLLTFAPVKHSEQGRIEKLKKKKINLDVVLEVQTMNSEYSA